MGARLAGCPRPEDAEAPGAVRIRPATFPLHARQLLANTGPRTFTAWPSPHRTGNAPAPGLRAEGMAILFSRAGRTPAGAFHHVVLLSVPASEVAFRARPRRRAVPPASAAAARGAPDAVARR